MEEDEGPPGRAAAAPPLSRVPEVVDGIQLNVCRSPGCRNFGVHPLPRVHRGAVRKGEARIADGYKIGGTSSASKRSSRLRSRKLRCTLCGSETDLRSNLAVAEELRRLSAYLDPPDAACGTEGCPSHGQSVRANPGPYYRHGTTPAGAPRWRCRACRKTVSAGPRRRRQRASYQNLTIFRTLVNKMPLRGISRTTGHSFQTVIDKIGLIHERCLAFVADREQRLPELPLERLWLATDRQDFVINWSDRKDRRNTQLTAVATADNLSGYVFGQHVNYDPEAEVEKVERLSEEAGDNDGRDPAFRRYARLWLPRDWEEAISAAREEPPPPTPEPGVRGRIIDAMRRAGQSLDPEVIDRIEPTRALPRVGMQVHLEYTVAAHYRLLRRLLGHAGKLRFFMDQDETLRMGCLAAFSDHLLAGRADAFYVQIDKDLTVDERKRRVREGERLLERTREEFGQPDWSDKQVRRFLIERDIRREDAREPPRGWRNRWVVLPHRALYEPEKAALLVTDRRDTSPAHLAALMDRASLHGVDRFFMQLRRMLSPLERPVATASNQRRVWRGYSPYNPARVQQLVDIYRVFYNYAKPGRNQVTPEGIVVPGKTPAERLGLAKGLVRIEDILYFDK